MAHNFKLSGDYYVSKAGNDSNAGTSPDAPLLTIQAALNKITTGVTRSIIVGSGVYVETINKSINVSSMNISIIADGKVIIQPFSVNDTITISINGNLGSSVSFLGVEFINGKAFFNSTAYNNQQTLSSCVLKNMSIITQGFNTSATELQRVGVYFLNTQFINTKVYISGNTTDENAFPTTGTVGLKKSILINSSIIGDKFIQQNTLSSTGIYSLIDTYIDSNSAIQIYSNVFNSFPLGSSVRTVPPGSNMINNNIEGKLIFSWNGSVSGNNSVFVPISLSQSLVDYSTYNRNSFYSNPKFNNPTLLDFTLQAGSPNISASSDYSSNIGGTEYAVTYTASSAAFTTNATSQSLDYRGLYYGISGSAVSGSITSGPMFLQWPRTKPMTSINWMGALDFNKTITASFAGNTNVPAYTTYTSASGQAGANPDRLKIAMRFSTQQTQPSTDAEWDNNGYWTAGTYQLFEINQKPTIDYKGTGNGDPTYAGSSGIGDLVPSWIQTEIILRNDYSR